MDRRFAKRRVFVSMAGNLFRQGSFKVADLVAHTTTNSGSCKVLNPPLLPLALPFAREGCGRDSSPEKKKVDNFSSQNYTWNPAFSSWTTAYEESIPAFQTLGD